MKSPYHSLFNHPGTSELNWKLSWTLSLHCNALRSALVSQSRLSQSQSYVTTDGQSASLSWCQAPIWDLRPKSRPRRSRRLLPASSRHAHSWHQAPLGPMAIICSVSTPLVFFLSLILLIDKGGVGLFLYRLMFTYYTLLHLRFHSFSFLPGTE
jgi:hypothetical protein